MILCGASEAEMLERAPEKEKKSQHPEALHRNMAGASNPPFTPWEPSQAQAQHACCCLCWTGRFD